MPEKKILEWLYLTHLGLVGQMLFWYLNKCRTESIDSYAGRKN